MSASRSLRLASTAAVAVAAIALTACGSDSSSDASNDDRYSNAPAAASTTAAANAATTTAAADGAATSDLTLAADPGGALKFDTTTLEAKAGTVTLTMDNPTGAGMPHAIAVKGNGVDESGEIAQPGGTSTVDVDLEPGTYTFYCPVAGHEAAGMTGTLTVS